MQANGIASVVLFSCLLIVASVWDIRKRIIPDTICIAVAMVGLLTFHPTKLLGILLGIPLLIAALAKEGGMGGGDVKFTAAVGFVLGLPIGCVGLAVGLLTAIIWYFVANGVRKMVQMPALSSKAVGLPLAPFLSIGFIGVTLLKFGGYL